MVELDAIFIVDQLERLRSLRGRRPDSTIGYRELAETLSRHAVNQDHVIGIIDRWIETQSFFPTPCELIEVARETASLYRPEIARRECDRCGGSGYTTIWVHTTRDPNGKPKREQITADEASRLRQEVTDDPGESAIAEYAQLCDCRVGRGIAEAQERQTRRGTNRRQQQVRRPSAKGPARAGDIFGGSNFPLFRSDGS